MSTTITLVVVSIAVLFLLIAGMIAIITVSGINKAKNINHQNTKKKNSEEEPNASTTTSHLSPVKKTSGNKEEGMGAGSLVLGLVIILTILAVVASWSGNESTATTARPNDPSQAPYIGETADLALSAIAEHESGNRQFKTDGSPLYNVNPDGTDNKKVACKYQINMEANKALIEELRADVEHSEKDCERVATAMYNRWGAWPWLGSLPHWAPNVVGGKFELTMPVQPGEWSKPVPVLDQFDPYISSTKCYEVMNHLNEVIRDCHIKPKQFQVRPKSLRFRSVTKEEVEVRVAFLPRAS